MHYFLILVSFMCLLSSCSKKDDDESTREANKRGVVEFTKIAALDGEVLTDEWGIASKSPVRHRSFCRVFFTRKILESEFDKIMQKVENFYKKVPFEIWIEDTNKNLIPLLEKRTYTRDVTFPGLSMRLFKDFGHYVPSDIELKQVFDEAGAKDWALVTAEVHKIPYEDLVKFCIMVLKKAPHVRFYLAYHEGKPVSSRMMIVFNRTVTGYFSSTLDKYRERGVASHLLSYTLGKLKKDGVQLFTLQALSTPVVWKKFGLRENGSEYIAFLSPEPSASAKAK